MQVYIEYVFFDNFVIDYIILKAVSVTMNLKSAKKNIALGAFIGAVFAVFLPLIRVNDLLLLAIKLFTGLVMIAVILKRKSFSKYLITYILFLTYTFVLGGALIGIILLFNGDIYSAVTLNYKFKVPIGAVAASGAFYIYLLVNLFKIFSKRKNIYPFKREIELQYNGKTYKTMGFIDSGNSVYDSLSRPVTIISGKLAERLIGEERVNNLLLHIECGKQFEKKLYITASGQKACMFLLEIDKLLIYSGEGKHTILNVPVGIVFNDFKGTDGCEALLHSGQIP